MTGAFTATTDEGNEIVNFTLCYPCVMHAIMLFESRKGKPQDTFTLETAP